MIFDRVRNFFRRIEIRTLPLSFQIHIDDDGKQYVRVFKQDTDGSELKQVVDSSALLAYGYKETSEDGKIVYVIDEHDRQTLLAVKSLNPECLADGSFSYDIDVPVFKYLRHKDDVSETTASTQIKIDDEPFKATAQLDFEPDKGLELKVGYATNGSGTLHPISDFPHTRDGNYVRVDDTFHRVPKQLSDVAQDMMAKGALTINIDQVPEFFMKDYALIEKDFRLMLTDSAEAVEIIDAPMAPIVKVDSSVPGWLDFEVGYDAAGIYITHQQLGVHAGESYIRHDESTWVKNDQSQWQQVNRELEGLQLAVTPEGYRQPVAAFASIEDFIVAIGGQSDLSAAYQAFIDQLTGFQADSDFALPAHMETQLVGQNIQLRPYQREGVQWLNWLSDNRLHGVLADDMGLGKTIQSILTMRLAYEASEHVQHSLVIAPKSVLFHWQREIERFFPEIDVHLHHGASKSYRLLRSPRPTIFISTYATAANDIEVLKDIPFFYVILDEATRIKNPAAKRTKAIKQLNAAHRLTLSGTPVENRPSELWSQFDFLMPGHLGRFGTFQREFETSIANGANNATEKLGRKISPFILRRKKEDVAKDLPEKIEMDEWCELSEEQEQLYGSFQAQTNQLRTALIQGKQVSYTGSILPIITKLKQICDHPALVTANKKPGEGRSEKFDWIVNKVDEIVVQDEQVVIFSHFLGMLDVLQEALHAKNARIIRIDGQTSNRQLLIDHFNDGKAEVALCSVLAAGHGINLTSANHVIHADRWWNPAVEDQATDRVHRIGQDKTVYVYRIMVQGTLEERIEKLLDAKRNLADRIIDAATGDEARAWSREELLEILRPLD